LDGQITASNGAIQIVADGVFASPGASLTGGLLDITAGSPINLAGSFDQLLFNTTGSGSATWINSGALEVLGATNASGDINLTTQTGDLLISGDVTALGNTVTLAAVNGAIQHGITSTVTANTLNASAVNGVDLVTAVSQLSAVNSGPTGIGISNTGALSVTQLNAGLGNIFLQNAGALTLNGPVTANNGSIQIIAASPMTVNGNVSAFSGISLNTAPSAGDDTLTLNGATIVSDTGRVLLNAGSGVTTAATTIEANAIEVYGGSSGGDVDLALAQLTVHDGFGRPGDSAMLQQLTDLGGTVPTEPSVAYFAAAGTLTLGAFDYFGDYLYLQADQVVLNNPINTYTPGSEALPTINPDVIIQMLPYTSGHAIAVESVMPLSPVAGTTYFTNSDHFQKFPGTSLFVGGTAYGGAVAAGQNGQVDIGGQNFLVASTSTISGTENIITTGLSNVATTSPSPPPTDPINTGVVNTLVQSTPTPTDPTGDAIPEETVEAMVPTEEQTDSETTPEEPADMIAMLEEQPLVDGTIEVNNTVLTCQ